MIYRGSTSGFLSMFGTRGNLEVQQKLRSIESIWLMDCCRTPPSLQIPTVKMQGNCIPESHAISPIARLGDISTTFPPQNGSKYVVLPRFRPNAHNWRFSYVTFPSETCLHMHIPISADTYIRRVRCAMRPGFSSTGTDIHVKEHTPYRILHRGGLTDEPKTARCSSAASGLLPVDRDLYSCISAFKNATTNRSKDTFHATCIVGQETGPD